MGRTIIKTYFWEEPSVQNNIRVVEKVFFAAHYFSHKVYLNIH